ncbi:pilus assembly protein TadG-related protein [Vibrio gigantis]|uniref:TadE/TadG family type IV pilus assembly protein n=1 Tax=Vibrio gigantis TaxID=296199 RepID=UPI003D12C59B
MRHSLVKQSGHAAILFAICVPVLFGVFMLGSDGARALQTKARLEEAAEAAVLAVSAEDSSNHPLAQSYIDHYLYDMDSLLDIQVDKLSCDEIDECAEQAEQGGARYFEYRVAGKSQHQSWFPGQGVIVGFGDTFDVTGSSKARKFQSKIVDITFVVDFSGSMNEEWSGGSKSKIEDLKDILELVTDELGKFNDVTPGIKHRVSMTGYNRRTVNANNAGKLVVRDQRVISKMGEYDKDDVVNFNKTIEHQFKVKGAAQRIPNGDGDAVFTDIFYTEDFDSFMKKVRTFKASGGTASLQGIIRAGQIVTSLAKNPNQLIIILSDGEDWNHYAGQTNTLVSRGMCTNIKNMINGGEVSADNLNDDIAVVDGMSPGKFTSWGEAMNARMSVIGFDYDLDANTGLRNCVGKDNVFKAENKQDILNKILALITEEVGHLAQ